MARIQRLHLRDVGPAITLREDFNSGRLTGRNTGGGLMAATSSSGDLSGPEHAAWLEERWYVSYVVRSYETPIAWYTSPTDHTPARWYVVAQKFSATTSKHQNAIPDSVKNARL